MTEIRPPPPFPKYPHHPNYSTRSLTPLMDRRMAPCGMAAFLSLTQLCGTEDTLIHPCHHDCHVSHGDNSVSQSGSTDLAWILG